MNVNLKSYINIEAEQEGRVYIFSIPMGAPYAEAEQIALNMVEAVREMAKQAEERAAKQAEDSAAKGE